MFYSREIKRYNMSYDYTVLNGANFIHNMHINNIFNCHTYIL